MSLLFQTKKTDLKELAFTEKVRFRLVKGHQQKAQELSCAFLLRASVRRTHRVRASKLCLRHSPRGLRLRSVGDTRTGMVMNASVRAFSLLFGVAKAIYRRRYGEACAYGHIHSIFM